MKDERRANHPCPVCGGRSYSWGKLRAQDCRFIADGASRWERFVGAFLKIPARRCDACGNLQVFAEPVSPRANWRTRDAAGTDFS